MNSDSEQETKEIIQTLDLSSWQGPFNSKDQQTTIETIEQGGVIFIPNLAFEINDSESSLLIPEHLERKTKNVSYIPQKNQIKGSKVSGDKLQNLLSMMSRFLNYSQDLIHALLPQYQNSLIIGRTSFRPAEIFGRKTSIRKDDTRLHVDAFPATPNQGKRILRVFCNINAEDRDRIWNLGEPFEAVVEKFAPLLKKPLPGLRTVLSLLGMTKSYRSLYDHYMLQLHNYMKLDEDYQHEVEKLRFHFPPGSTWIVMTDTVSHAALAGQYMLEQTFYLPCEAMQNPSLSPLYILEHHLGQKLV